MLISTILQLAEAKEQFLESAVQLITPVVNNGHEMTFVIKDVECLIEDETNLFAMLLRCDEQHNLLATTDNYPCSAIESELTKLFERFLDGGKKLQQVAELLQKKGFELKNLAQLIDVCSHAHRLVEDDQSFYDTVVYQNLAQQSYTEYKNNKIETWPV